MSVFKPDATRHEGLNGMRNQGCSVDRFALSLRVHLCVTSSALRTTVTVELKVPDRSMPLAGIGVATQADRRPMAASGVLGDPRTIGCTAADAHHTATYSRPPGLIIPADSATQPRPL